MISVDPGLRGCALAVWHDGGALDYATYVVGRTDRLTNNTVNELAIWSAMAYIFEQFLLERFLTGRRLVLEMPQVYERSKSKGDPNDLMRLAALVGALTKTSRGGVMLYKPREWKGQVPKEIMTARTKKALTAEELARVELPKAKSLHHNVWDAIGIGLHHLKVTGVRRAK